MYATPKAYMTVRIKDEIPSTTKGAAVVAIFNPTMARETVVATAPNAIVYGSGRLTVKDMARAGFVLNLIGAVVITAVSLIAFH